MHEEQDDVLAIARAALEDARRRLAKEIGAYPAPISGCDAQFNHLLAQRARLASARAALDTDVFVPTSRHPDRG